MYIHIYVYIYIYTEKHVYIHVYIYICIYAHVYMYIHSRVADNYLISFLLFEGCTFPFLLTGMSILLVEDCICCIRKDSSGSYFFQRCKYTEKVMVQGTGSFRNEPQK